jgi:hypothetical protein
VGRVLLLRAFKSDSASGLSRVLRHVTSARRAAGRPIVCFMIVDPEAEVPSDAGRAALQRTTLSLLDYCESLTLIVEGSALHQTLLRASLRGMASTPGVQASRVRVVEDLQMAAKMAAEPGLMLQDLVRRGSDQIVWLVGDSVVVPQRWGLAFHDRRRT